MNKFDVLPEDLKNFITKLRNNQNFLAMAITMPYKKKILNFAKNLDDFAKKTGSANLIINKKNNLFAYNTDIFGAIESIKTQLIKYNNIIIIGLGGTGSALFNFLRKKYSAKKFILISSKSKSSFRLKKLILFKKINVEILKKKSLIINCTPLGSNLSKKYLNKTPISQQLFSSINKKSFIFDVVYSPKINLLSRLSKKFSIDYKNGVHMNTIQAERALKLIFKK